MGDFFIFMCGVGAGSAGFLLALFIVHKPDNPSKYDTEKDNED